jgi:hypothetical protein
MVKKLESHRHRSSSHTLHSQHEEQTAKVFQAEQRKLRPSIDRIYLNELITNLTRSLLDSTRVTIVTYDEISGEKAITGIVTSMDLRLKRAKVECEDCIEYVPFVDVLHVQ